jgi:hypothetical protein
VAAYEPRRKELIDSEQSLLPEAHLQALLTRLRPRYAPSTCQAAAVSLPPLLPHLDATSLSLTHAGVDVR